MATQNLSIVSPADQENVHPNVAPPLDALANVRDAARVAVAAHIDGSAKNVSKRKRGPRDSDAEKIESLLSLIDGAETAFQLVADVMRYLSAVEHAPPSLGLAVEALKFATFAGKRQTESMRSAIDSTKAKRNANQAHRKLTSDGRLQFRDQQLQHRALTSTNPRKMLQAAIKNTKQRLEPRRLPVEPVPAPDAAAAIVVPRSKQRKLTHAERQIFTKDEQRRHIYDSVWLPRPKHENVVYSVAEAVSVVRSLVCQNDTHQPRAYLDAIKQKMIDDGRIPVKRSQLNNLLKAAEEGKALPTFWNRRGHQEIMGLAELRSKFDENARREGNSWTEDQTERALIAKMKQKLTDSGIDSSTLKPPHKKTVQAYHSALMSMPDLQERLCKPKNALREAAETSLRNMLSFLCCVGNARAYVCADPTSIPPEYRFDAAAASPGCIKMRRIIAKSHGVPESHVQFSARQLFFNTDDTAVFSNFSGDGGGEGVSDKGKTAVVTREAAQNKSYNCHYQGNNKRDLDGQKVRLTNTIAAGGNILPAWVQVPGFSEEEIPPDKVPKGYIVLKVPRLFGSISENSWG